MAHNDNRGNVASTRSIKPHTASYCTISSSWSGGPHIRRRCTCSSLRRAELGRIERAVAREGWKIVFLSRLSPVFSFSLLNVFYGAVRVPVGPYLLASFVGMLPGTAIYVYAGVMAGDLSGAPGRPGRTPWQWGFKIAGFVLTALLVVYVTRRAQRILNEKLSEEDPPA